MKRKYNKFDMVNAFLLGAAVGESLYIKITAYSNGYLKKEKVIIQ